MVLLSLVWGSSFILIKKGLVAYPPETLAYLRIFISFLALLPLTIYHIRGVRLKQFVFIFFVGFFGNGIPPFMFAEAQVHVDSAVAGILNSLTPIFTFILGVVIFRGGFSWIKLVGVLIGFTGGAVIILGRSGGELGMGNIYGLLIVLATFCYGTSINLVNFKLRDLPSIKIGSLTFIIIGPVAGFLLFATTDFVPILNTHPDGVMSLIYIATLAIFGTAMASVLFFRLVKQTNALFASTVTYLINIVAIGWGWFDGEQIGVWVVLGMILILGGVYLSGKRKKA